MKKNLKRKKKTLKIEKKYKDRSVLRTSHIVKSVIPQNILLIT